MPRAEEERGKEVESETEKQYRVDVNLSFRLWGVDVRIGAAGRRGDTRGGAR